MCIYVCVPLCIYMYICASLLPPGIHPTTISDSFQLATERAVQILTAMSSPLSLSDRDSLLKSATTSLSSKVCTIV